MAKVLLVDLESPLARQIAHRLLENDHEVVGVAPHERVLGTLKTNPKFSFHKLDLRESGLVRSYLYGVSHVMIADRGVDIVEKLDHVFASLMHLKARIPAILYLSSAKVFPVCNSTRFLEDQDCEAVDEVGDLFLNAEIMVSNYCSHMGTRGAILRLPILADTYFTDEDFAQFLKLMKKNRDFMQSSEDFFLQWTSFNDLMSAILKLIDSQWNEVEKFHLVSFSKPYKEAFEMINRYLGTKASIVDKKPLIQAAESILSLTPLLQKKFKESQGLQDFNSLNYPALDDSLSRRMFPSQTIIWDEHFKNLIKKLR